MAINDETKELSSLDRRRAYDAQLKAKQQQHKQLSSPRQSTPPPVTTSSSHDIVKHYWLKREADASSRITALFRGVRDRKCFTRARRAAPQLQRHEPQRLARDDSSFQDDPMTGEPSEMESAETAGASSTRDVRLEVKEVWFDANEELEADKPPAEPTTSEPSDPLKAELDATREAHAQTRWDLEQLKMTIKDQKEDVESREAAVTKREKNVEQMMKRASAETRAAALTQARAAELDQREKDLVQREEVVERWLKRLESKEIELSEKERLSERTKRLAQHTVEDLKQRIKDREEAVLRREAAAESSLRQAETREALAARQEAEAESKRQQVARRECDTDLKSEEVTARAREVQAKNDALEDLRLRLEDQYLKEKKELEAREAHVKEMLATAAVTTGGGALATGGADVAAPIVSWPDLKPKLGCVGYHVQKGTTPSAFQKVIDDIGEHAGLPKERYVSAQPGAPLHSYPLVILFIKVAGSRLSEGVIHGDEVERCRAVVAPGGKLLIATINAGHNPGVAKELPADCPRREMIDGLLHFSYVSGCPPKRPHELSKTSKLTETAMAELSLVLPKLPPKHEMTVATVQVARSDDKMRDSCKLFSWLTPMKSDRSPRPSKEAQVRPSSQKLGAAPPAAQPTLGAMLSGESGGYGGEQFLQSFQNV